MNYKKVILVTGSTGFIGRNLMRSSFFKEFTLRPISLRREFDNSIFDNVSCVIHLAGISVLKDQNDFYSINHDLSLKIAFASKRNSVNHFLYISTTKVFGESYESYTFNEKSNCLPNTDYGKSKLKAESSLLNLADDSFNVTILRPSLVYGEGVGGNVLSIINLINKGLPMPFKNVENKRSVLYVGNLVAFMQHVIENQIFGIFIVTDGIDISTSTLISEIALSLDKKELLFKLPQVFKFILKYLRPNIYSKLFGSLIFDVESSFESIGFVPPFSYNYGINAMVNSYKENNGN